MNRSGMDLPAVMFIIGVVMFLIRVGGIFNTGINRISITIIRAILVAILTEQFFQFFGIGFKNVI